MAALTFSITSSTTSAGQQLAAAATTMTYYGNNQSRVTVEVSPTDSNYVPIGSLLAGQGGAFPIPSGWYVRVVSAANGATVPTGTAAVE